ncbi:hypothetical protein QQF64_023674 [Cirrhinus molitorella]|uniref:Uncharacterized protein n=1 Tax=Cirrhinus molitorella TaxID=172907 RepID=A0ABR3NJ37_9TELE
MVEDEARANLTQQMNLSAYKKLNETVLAQVIIFNKRCEGEASRLTLDTYKKASTNAINEDIYSTLSPLEKELSKILTRTEIRGKRGRKVAVFCHERMKVSSLLVQRKRKEAWCTCLKIPISLQDLRDKEKKEDRREEQWWMKTSLGKRPQLKITRKSIQRRAVTKQRPKALKLVPVIQFSHERIFPQKNVQLPDPSPPIRSRKPFLTLKRAITNPDSNAQQET